MTISAVHVTLVVHLLWIRSAQQLKPYMLSYRYRYLYTFTVYVYQHSLASRDSSDSSPPLPSSGAAYRPATWTVFWEPREKSGVAGISSDQTLPQLPATQLREVHCKLVNLGGVVNVCVHPNFETTKQSKANQINSPEEVFFFPEKNWLPQVGFELTTLCSLDRGSSVDMGRISYTNTKQDKANDLNLYMNIRSILYTCIQRGYKMFAHYTSICTLPVVIPYCILSMCG